MKKYKGILLDFDGTIVDSEKSRLESLNEVLKEFKVNISQNEWEVTYRSLGSALILDILKEKYKLTFETQKAYQNSHTIREKIELKKGVPLIKGALDFLHFLDGKKIPFCICSGGKRDHVKKVLEMHKNFGIKDILFFGRESYQNRKPSPDAYLKGLELLNLKTNEILVFDDAKSGCQAGINAKCETIAINYSENEDFDELELKGKYKNFDEFEYKHLFK